MTLEERVERALPCGNYACSEDEHTINDTVECAAAYRPAVLALLVELREECANESRRADLCRDDGLVESAYYRIRRIGEPTTTARLPSHSACGEASEVTYATAANWPEAVSDGLSIPCPDCGLVPMFDYSVDDKFWKDHVPGQERTGVVCLPCLDRRCNGIGLASAIQRVQWTGSGHTVIMEPVARYEYERALLQPSVSERGGVVTKLR